MRRYSLLVFWGLQALACRQTPGPYQNKEKWMISDKRPAKPLLGRPRFVTEYIIMARDTARPDLRKYYYLRYGFDAEGNMTSRYSYLNDTLSAKLDYWIDQNGMQIRLTDISSGKVYNTVSRRLSDGRYKVIIENPNAQRTAWMGSYLAGGDERVEEQYSDTMALGKPIGVNHVYYTSNRMVKIIGQTPTTAVESRYYYSTFDMPDSILSFDGTGPENRLIQRLLLSHNSHGDVETELLIVGKDTNLVEQSQYTYDDKGNWTRQLSTTTVDKTGGYSGDKVSITDREFVYW